MGRPGQAPKQAADPSLPPRLEFPDACYIFPNLNTRRPGGSTPSQLMCVLSCFQLARGGRASHPINA